MAKKVTESKLITYGIYSHILESFQHYNRIQVTYRTFVSTWILATFIGIGYSLSSLEVDLPVHPLIIVTLICFASFCGISLIYYMDLIVTERSIVVLVHESLEMEKKNPWLPQVIHTCDEINHLLGYVNMKSIFYLGCYMILFLTLAFSIILFSFIEQFPPIIPIIGLLIIVLIFLGTYFFLFSSKKKNPYSRIKNLQW